MRVGLLVLVLVLLVLVLALFNLFNSTNNFSSQTVSYSDFMAQVDAGEVKGVTLDGEQIKVTAKDGSVYAVIRPMGEQVTERLLSKGVGVRADAQEQSGLMTIITAWLRPLKLSARAHSLASAVCACASVAVSSRYW